MSSVQIQMRIEKLKAGSGHFYSGDAKCEQALALWEIAKQLAAMNEDRGINTETPS